MHSGEIVGLAVSLRPVILHTEHKRIFCRYKRIDHRRIRVRLRHIIGIRRLSGRFRYLCTRHRRFSAFSGSFAGTVVPDSAAESDAPGETEEAAGVLPVGSSFARQPVRPATSNAPAASQAIILRFMPFSFLLIQKRGDASNRIPAFPDFPMTDPVIPDSDTDRILHRCRMNCTSQLGRRQFQSLLTSQSSNTMPVLINCAIAPEVV